MKLVLLIIFNLLLCISSFSQSLKEQAQTALTADLAGLKKELSRDIKTYHWTGYSNLDYAIHSRDPLFFEHFFAAKAVRFFDNPSMSNFGDGLYSTLNPQNSKDYGDFLLAVNLKKGSQFLDFRGADFRGLEVRKHTSDLIKEYCGYSAEQPEGKTYTRNNEIYVSILRSTLSTTPQCNELFVKSIADLKVDFATYTWAPEGTKKYGTCTSRDETSFVIFGKTSIINTKINTYNLSPSKYSTFLQDNGYIQDISSEVEKERLRYWAEHYTGLFKKSTNFNINRTYHKTDKIYMDKFRNRVTTINRRLVSDYSNIEVKGFFSQYKTEGIDAGKLDTHYNDYYFVDQFSRISKSIDGKPPKGMWSLFEGLNDYLDLNSAVIKTIESSRFNCRQDLYPEDQIIKFNEL